MTFSTVMLRNRIFIGVAPLVILLMMVGGYAVWLFFRLGNAVNTTLHENYVSIAAMRDLKDAAEHIERVLGSGSIAGNQVAPERRQTVLEQQAAVCRRNVDAELAIITEPGEREAAEGLRRDDEAFLQAAASFVAGGPAGIDDLRRSLGA